MPQQPVPQQQPINNNNNTRRPQLDNSIEEYETFDESPFPSRIEDHRILTSV